MDKSDECRRYKWSSLATNLLVSIWSHDLVQNHLKMSSRNQPVWESIARYMSRKGFLVTGLQCKTRIKNMLCSYHEAVRKNDPSSFEPYYEIFKKVLTSKYSKKRDSKTIKLKHIKYYKETDDIEESLDSNSLDSDKNASQSVLDTNYQMEFLDVNNQDSQTSGLLSGSEILRELENVIIKAIDSQTKAITNAIKAQSQMIEKLLSSEHDQLKTIMASERESRKQLEIRLDKLLSKFESIILPQIRCMNNNIFTKQNQ